MSWDKFLIVCFAGGIGSGARYVVSTLTHERLGQTFAWGTLTVNVIGSFVIALVFQLALSTTSISPPMRLALTTGLMGGFTTYSTFNQETVLYLQQSAWWLAGANVIVTIVACLVAGFAGQALARAIT